MHSIRVETRIENLEELDARLRPLFPEFSGLSYSESEGLLAWFSSMPSDLAPLSQQVTAQASIEATRRIVQAAISFGQRLVTEFASENVLMGITQAGKTKLIADTLRDVSYYLANGSLYEADTAASQVEITEEMSPFLTSERIRLFRNKIRAYLGVPLL